MEATLRGQGQDRPPKDFEVLVEDAQYAEEVAELLSTARLDLAAAKAALGIRLAATSSDLCTALRDVAASAAEWFAEDAVRVRLTDKGGRGSVEHTDRLVAATGAEASLAATRLVAAGENGVGIEQLRRMASHSLGAIRIALSDAVISVRLTRLST